MHCHQLSGKFLSPKLHQRGCIPSQHRSPHRRSTPSLLQLYGSEGLVSQLASGYIVDVAQSMESPSKVVDVVPTSTEVGEGANCYCGTRGTEPDSQQGFLIFLHYTHLMGRYNRQGRKAKNRRSWDSYSNRAYSRTQMLCAVKQLQNYDCRGVYSDT